MAWLLRKYMDMMTRPFAYATFTSLFMVCACGGNAPFEGSDAGASGGALGVGGHAATTGGSQGMGGQKTSVGGGSSAGTGGAMVCCNAMPVCDAGEVLISSQADCPSNSQCRSISLCCTTIWCAKVTAQDAGTCNPSTEFNRHYVATSPSQCAVIDYSCQTNTTMFGNACGCGCQQDSSCPQYVDCMPGTGTSDPLCSDLTRCPYSTRAL